MDLEFVRQAVWSDAKECVQDLAFVDGQLKPWWIAPTALDDLVESRDHLEGVDYLVILERCRSVIEPVAAAKFQRGDIEGAGVMIHSVDLEQEQGKHGHHQKVAPGFWLDPKTGRKAS
jgi:hypothetical protein